MTLANKAYDAIRMDIIRGDLAAETPLRLAELKTKYGMGFSPLREALNRLQSEHFVQSVDLKGFRVAPSSIEQMQDAMETRREIETLALAAAIKHGDDLWEGAIVAALHGLNLQAARPAQGEDLWELERRHFQFHRALISACQSPWKLRVFEQLYGATERYRIPALLNRTQGPERDISTEHGALAEAALARDTQLACDRLSTHYQTTAHWIAVQMRNAAAA